MDVTLHLSAPVYLLTDFTSGNILSGIQGATERIFSIVGTGKKFLKESFISILHFIYTAAVRPFRKPGVS